MAETGAALAVADDHERCETEALTALNGLGDAVDVNELLDQLLATVIVAATATAAVVTTATSAATISAATAATASATRTARATALRARSAGKPRLSVHRSGRHIYAQVIDDTAGKTIASASTLDKDVKGKTGATRDAAAAVGKTLAERAKKAGVSTVVFDRGGFLFHGRVKALADAAREGGLEF